MNIFSFVQPGFKNLVQGNFFLINIKIKFQKNDRIIPLLLPPNDFTMSYDLTGKLVAKFETVQRTATFKTREFVIEKTEDIGGRMITNYAKFQCVQDKTTMPDRFNIGETVKVHFNIKGTKWEKNGQTNYITNLDAWRIESVNLQQQDNQTNYSEPVYNMSDIPAAPDDLPF